MRAYHTVFWGLACPPTHTTGLFVELGADYWARTWPNIFNLYDLPSSQRVRTRAKMFIDIAMVEAEQASPNPDTNTNPNRNHSH